MSFSDHIPVEIIRGRLYEAHFLIKEKFVISADAILNAFIPFNMIIGIIGVPVFQSNNGGIEYFFGVTGGYLIGFIFAATIISVLSNNGLKKGLSIWAMIIGNIFIYLSAVIWLSVYDFGWPEKGYLFSQAVYPFLIGDFIKLILASLSVNILWKLSRRIKK